MRRTSWLGSLSSPFLAGTVTTSSQFLVELVKCDVIASFIGGAAPADRRCFGLRGFVGRIASLVMHRADCDPALCDLKFDQIAKPYARLLLNRRRYFEPEPIFNKYGHDYYLE